MPRRRRKRWAQRAEDIILCCMDLDQQWTGHGDCFYVEHDGDPVPVVCRVCIATVRRKILVQSRVRGIHEFSRSGSNVDDSVTAYQDATVEDARLAVDRCCVSSCVAFDGVGSVGVAVQVLR